MLKVLGFSKTSSSGLSKSNSTPLILKQAHDFELALQAMDYLLDDRTKEGLHLINDDPDSTIKTLAYGVIKFLESTLGFEPEVMRQAGEILTKAENLSSRDRTKMQKLKLQTSSIFPPGTEYAVTYAESNLLNALIMLLSESAIESVKALYKLRKAYHTLDEVFKILNEHEANLQKNSNVKLNANSNGNNTASTLGKNANESNSSFNSSLSGHTFADIPFQLTTDQIKNPKINSMAQKITKMRLDRLNGCHIGNTPAYERLRSSLGSEQIKEKQEDQVSIMSNFENQSTIDEFIISGANLCYGILQLVLSLLPPAVGKVLSIVGLKGSREDGLNKIWKSVESRNVLGCIGLLGLLTFYDGPFQFTDADFDLPELNKLEAEMDGETSLTPHSSNSSNYASPCASLLSPKLSKKTSKISKIIRSESLHHPATTASTTNNNNNSNGTLNCKESNLSETRPKLEESLLYARALFPNSALWLLQEARMLTSKGMIAESLKLMDSINRKIEMRQVEALLVFDRAIALIFLHQYERAAVEISRLLDINAWSPGLYTYCAGACYLELYRMCVMGEITDANELKRKSYFRSKALELFKKAPVLSKTAKKQMPFDNFVLRKMAQISSVAKKNKLDLIDAIGTSPIHELIYFWNGYNRMPTKHLRMTSKLLDYTISKHAKIPETTEEGMIRNLLQSLIQRRLGKISEGNAILDEKVLTYIIQTHSQGGGETGSYQFVKLSANPWMYTTALYEKSLFIWKDEGLDGLDDAKEWLRRAMNYADDYELSTRVGMKIKAALGRLESF